MALQVGAPLATSADDMAEAVRGANSCVQWARREAVHLALAYIPDGRQLAACACVSREWAELVSDDTLWHALCLRRWPSIAKACSSSAAIAGPISSGGAVTTFRSLFARCHIAAPRRVPLRAGDVAFLADVAYRGEPAFSISLDLHVAPRQRPTFTPLQQPFIVEPPTCRHLAGGPADCAGRSTAEDCAASLHVSVIALRRRDGRLFKLLDGRPRFVSDRLPRTARPGGDPGNFELACEAKLRLDEQYPHHGNGVSVLLALRAAELTAEETMEMEKGSGGKGRATLPVKEEMGSGERRLVLLSAMLQICVEATISNHAVMAFLNLVPWS